MSYYTLAQRNVDCAIALETGWTEIRGDADRWMWRRGRNPQGVLTDIPFYHGGADAGEAELTKLDLIRWFAEYGSLQGKLAFCAALFSALDPEMSSLDGVGRSFRPEHIFKLMLATPEQVARAAAKVFEIN